MASIEGNREKQPSASDIRELERYQEAIERNLRMLERGEEITENVYGFWKARNAKYLVDALIISVGNRRAVYRQIGDSGKEEKERIRGSILSKISPTLIGPNPIDQKVINEVKNVFLL